MRTTSKEIQMIDANGDRIIVIETQEYIDASSKDGEEWIPGMKRLQLRDGSAVNFIDDETFQVVPNNQILRRPT